MVVNCFEVKLFVLYGVLVINNIYPQHMYTKSKTKSMRYLHKILNYMYTMPPHLFLLISSYTVTHLYIYTYERLLSCNLLNQCPLINRPSVFHI